MQLIRLGDLRGFNLDMLVSWEIEAPPEPAPEPAPEPTSAPLPEGEAPPAPDDPLKPMAPMESVAPIEPVTPPAPVAAPEPGATEPPPLRMTLTLASAGAMQTISLEGREAEVMRDYLQSKSGALVR